MIGPSNASPQLFLTNGSQSIALGRGRLRLGRGEGCDLRLRDIRTSRQHCEIFEHQGRYFLRDLGSTNGTYVNGVDVQATPLEPGDVIAMGGETFLIDTQPRGVWDRLVEFTRVFARTSPAAAPAVSGSL